jgi:1,4-alpha-glucan branching enzyme
MYSTMPRTGAIRFSLRPAGSPQDVRVAGDFSKWRPLVMRRLKDGTYVRVVPGIHSAFEYKFVVDGGWITDPDHSHWAMSPAGTLNSVGAPSPRRAAPTHRVDRRS